MRDNTLTEMEFQGKIVNVFEEYHDRLGFPIMTDILISWLVYEIQERASNITRFRFLLMFDRTWRDIKKERTRAPR